MDGRRTPLDWQTDQGSSHHRLGPFRLFSVRVPARIPQCILSGQVWTSLIAASVDSSESETWDDVDAIVRNERAVKGVTAQHRGRGPGGFDGNRR